MGYSILELSTLDLDIFVKDNSKYIHIATGGGNLPKALLNSDAYNESLREILRNIPQFDFDIPIEINPNLTDITGINDEQLEDYLSDFTFFAKIGFYTYDKTKLGNFDDFTFHLVAKPKLDKANLAIKLFLNDQLRIFNVDFNIPSEFVPFNLEEILKNDNPN